MARASLRFGGCVLLACGLLAQGAARATPIEEPPGAEDGPAAPEGQPLSPSATTGDLVVEVRSLGEVQLELTDPSGQKFASSSPYHNPQAAAGDWQVVARGPCCEETQHRFQVPPAETTLVKLELTPLGGLEVNGDPSGAVVQVSGPGYVDRGGLPWFAQGLRQGSYLVAVSRNGYLPMTETAYVRPGEVTRLRIALEKEVLPELSDSWPLRIGYDSEADLVAGLFDLGVYRTRAHAVYAPLQLGLWRAQADTFVGLLQLSLSESRAGDFFLGLQASFWRNTAHRYLGLAQVAPINSGDRSYALLQLGAHNATSHSLSLLQLGGYNQSREWIGLVRFAAVNDTRDCWTGLFTLGAVNKTAGRCQSLGLAEIGGFNFDEDLLGIQLGLQNTGGTLSGMQLGLFNSAHEVHGLQAGVLNITDELHGVQLGVANISRRHGLPFVPIANAGW